MGLIQKIAVITGAGTGVGQSCTLALLSEGYSVVLAGRRENRLKETVEKAGEFKKNTFVVQADVSEQNSVKALFKKTKQRFGRLDLLFNNAGISSPSIPLEELKFEHWKIKVGDEITEAGESRRT